MRSLVEIAIRIAVPFLTFFSGNGGSKFRKKFEKFREQTFAISTALGRAPRVREVTSGLIW